MTWLKVFLIELAFNKVYIFVSSTVRRSVAAIGCDTIYEVKFYLQHRVNKSQKQNNIIINRSSV